MKRLAPIAMFLAWLLYGAMPAMGMPSIATPGMQHTDTQPADHSTHSQPAVMGADKALHSTLEKHCPHGGKICSAPFCAGCLTTIPSFGARHDEPFSHDAPAPADAEALVSSGSAPPTPPPRA
ncbi:hypothetical protein EPK99_15790 [Neorhizobium lilium]|uniref:Uncharacterized protein n=1 Tax=Neorhizobium lilium TaxID=2503024 RepID=A0A444LG01_9HYPH|nr:hypothetical protein [Neorhizobium lilium]RWX77112.1 hypothetical protein EPK99_15790 [Neorhizobium lilium]